MLNKENKEFQQELEPDWSRSPITDSILTVAVNNYCAKFVKSEARPACMNVETNKINSALKLVKNENDKK